MHDDPQTRLRRAARELGAAAAVPRPHAVRARGHQRRRRGALGSGLLVLALLAGGGTAYLTVARQQAAAPPLTRSTRAHSMLPAGKVGPRSAVPWSQVGPGWALAGYTQGWPYAGRASGNVPFGKAVLHDRRHNAAGHASGTRTSSPAASGSGLASRGR